LGDQIPDVRLVETKHSVSTYAYSVERNGRRFAYSADTVFHEPISTLAEDADLLIHEATFIDEQSEVAKLTFHSTGSDAGRAARRANVKHLVLFHIPPPNEHYERKIGEEAAEAFGGSTTLGEDMLEFSL
jgi:ribonuclease Z